MTSVTLYLGDCVAVMRALPSNSIDSIVSDPPYELGFMGKAWDASGIANSVEMWTEALRVLKPGGHLLAFSHSRTYHRMVCAIEDAGFEVRDRIRFECSVDTKYGAFWGSLSDDQRGVLLELLNEQDGLGSELAWTYGSGFPKSHNVGKAIDKAAGAEREVVSERYTVKRLNPGATHEKAGGFGKQDTSYTATDSAPATEFAAQWEGWGTALKPAHEPIVVARKPLSGSVVENVERYGVGALNINGCRVATEGETLREGAGGIPCRHDETTARGRGGEASAERRYAERRYAENGGTSFALKPSPRGGDERGRWPANVIHDGSEAVSAAFPAAPGQQGDLNVTGRARRPGGAFGNMAAPRAHAARRDSGSAARFFYCAKASKADRDHGLSGEEAAIVTFATANGTSGKPSSWSAERDTKRRNTHPTVKPTELMRYLVRLVTPVGGVVMDPFMGSGSTGRAAVFEGMAFLGIDQEAQYVDFARQRIAGAAAAAGRNDLSIVVRRVEETEAEAAPAPAAVQPADPDQLDMFGGRQ